MKGFKMGVAPLSGLVFVSLLLPLPVAALDQVVGAPPSDVLTVEDRAVLRADLERVAQVLGVETKPVAAEAAVKPVEPKPEALKTEKTIAEVSDRALTLVERAVTSAAVGLEKAAPQVWRVMVRQQYAKAIQGPVFALFLFLCMLGLKIVSRRTAGVYREGEDGAITFGRIVTWIALGIAFVNFGDSISRAAVYVINPEYYALRDLVQILLGKTPGG